MTKVCEALPGPIHQQQCTPSASTPAMPPPRRPRVREVSSRFMSPIVTSSSSGDLHLPSSRHGIATATSTHHHNQQQRSQSAHRRETRLTESLSYADENRLETARSLDTPLGSFNKQGTSLQKKNPQHQHIDGHQLRTLCSNKFPMRSGIRSRPDTPLLQSRDRSIHRAHNSPRSVVASVASTAAAKLVQMSGMSAEGSTEVPVPKCVKYLDLDSQCAEQFPKNPSSSDCEESKPSTITDQESRCNSPTRVENSKVRPLPDFRSSMSEANLLPTMSSKLLARNRDTPKNSAFPCYRSSPFPSCEQQSVSGVPKSVYRAASSGNCIPPYPTSTKHGIESRKAAKVSNHQEQVHFLRMFHNYHLQWRYANAKAEASVNAQALAAKISFHDAAVKISELRDSVNKKRVELRELKKERTLSTVLESQMPCLNEWSTVEDEYSTSLAGAVKALQDTSLRLPIIGNVKADTEEVGRALNSALNMMELTSSLVEGFLPKGEEMNSSISELSEVVNRERALIEECGHLMNRTNMLQVMESSLRSQLVQLKLNTSSLQAKAKE